MHGLGNDYIYVDTHRYLIKHPEQVAEKWSTWHTGIGSDGLVLIGPSEEADFSMRIFNADGSEAMMCGNATRCIGKYVYENGLTSKTQITLSTLSGIKTIRLHLKDQLIDSITVDMGNPHFTVADQCTMTSEAKPVTLTLDDGSEWTGTFVSMGNPHFVIFTDNLESIDIPQVGPKLEHHPAFPQRANIEFVQQFEDGSLRMRVWERGSGITQACGTGACATAVAAITTGRCSDNALVRMDGGDLQIEWNPQSNIVYMTGSATRVFEGEIELEED